MAKRVKFAKSISGKIQVVDGKTIDPGQLVRLEKVMTAANRVFPGFIPFGDEQEDCR